MPCDDALPQPSPEAPTSSLSSPPPVTKRSVARRLSELQNTTSPTKPCKLRRTESGILMPVISLGDPAVIVPVDLNSCMTEALPFTAVIEDLDAVLDEHYEPDDPKGKRPTDPRLEQLSQAVDKDTNDTEDESGDSDSKDKARMDIDAKPGPCPAKCTLLSTMRKKGVTGSSSAYNSANIADILDTPTTSKKMPFDPKVTPDAKGLFEQALGLFEHDD